MTPLHRTSRRRAEAEARAGGLPRTHSQHAAHVCSSAARASGRPAHRPILHAAVGWRWERPPPGLLVRLHGARRHSGACHSRVRDVGTAVGRTTTTIHRLCLLRLRLRVRGKVLLLLLVLLDSGLLLLLLLHQHHCLLLRHAALHAHGRLHVLHHAALHTLRLGVVVVRAAAHGAVAARAVAPCVVSARPVKHVRIHVVVLRPKQQQSKLGACEVEPLSSL